MEKWGVKANVDKSAQLTFALRKGETPLISLGGRYIRRTYIDFNAVGFVVNYI